MYRKRGAFSLPLYKPGGLRCIRREWRPKVTQDHATGSSLQRAAEASPGLRHGWQQPGKGLQEAGSNLWRATEASPASLLGSSRLEKDSKTPKSGLQRPAEAFPSLRSGRQQERRQRGDGSFQNSVWRPAENRVVLTSVMSRGWKLQIPQPQSRLSLVLEDQMIVETDRWGEAGSPTDLVPHHLGFLPMSGRLMKSESEDSGVEMASGDHAPLTPVESEKSFSLDYQDGFQMAGEDESAPAPQEGCSKDNGPQELLPVLDHAYWQDLCVKRKFTEMGQRSQKNHLYVRKPNKLIQRRQSLVDLEELKSRYSHQPVSVDGLLDEASGGYSQTTSGRSNLEEEKTEKKAQQPACLPIPGPGIRCLENLCQLMEKVSQLQKANTQLQHERQILECRIRALECQVCTLQQEKKCFFEQITEEPKQPQMDPQPGDPEAMETEKEEEGNLANEDKYPDLVDSWHPHSFRARSASDTHMLQRQTHPLGNKIDRSMMSAIHSASSPSLVGRLDSSFHTWPSSQKVKNDGSRWGRVKGLLNRIRRRSSKTSEVIPSSDITTKSRHCRADTELDQEGSCPRRRFLPNLMVKIHRSKHVSMG